MKNLNHFNFLSVIPAQNYFTRLASGPNRTLPTPSLSLSLPLSLFCFSKVVLLFSLLSPCLDVSSVCFHNRILPPQEISLHFELWRAYWLGKGEGRSRGGGLLLVVQATVEFHPQ